MSLLNPLGLLALLAIPVLVLIYVIKNKYTEQTIASTYLWQLSEKFLKRRNPINKIAGIISLILQILVVLFISVALANPVFAIHGAAHDYCFILDGSGSMSIRQEGSTRFDLGKKNIEKVISDSAEGCTYTLVFVGDATSVVYKNIEDKGQAKELLNGLKPSYSANGVTAALAQAQEYFNENPALKVYLVTDKDYVETENIQVVNVSLGEDNYALTDVNFNISEGKLTVGGKVISYESAASLTLELYIDGREEVAESINVEVNNKLELTEFSFSEIEQNSLQSARVVITNVDALAQDNEITVFNEEYENSFSVLLVSGNKQGSYILRQMLASNPNSQVSVVEAEKYAAVTESYDLYVFDTFDPQVLPSDGAVWFVNPQKTLEKTGFSVQSLEELNGGGELVYSKSTLTFVRDMLKGTIPSDNAVIAKYIKCGTYRNFTTLMTCEGTPVVFTGTNSYENSETVFAFDIHDTNTAMMANFLIVMNNLLNYTFPNVLDKTAYNCGEMLTVHADKGGSVTVNSPSGSVSYIDGLRLTEVGVYTITVRSGGTEKVYNIYSAFPEEERFTTVQETSLKITGEASAQKRDGTFSQVWMWFIILAVLVAADWGVYCYEQYQLR